MPRPRFQRAAPEKRQALLDAAAREFAAHGYDGASVNRILDAAGFSKGSFYYYFDDKADLAAAVLEHESEHHLASLRALGQPESPRAFWREVHLLMERTQAIADARPHAMDALSRLGTAAARDPALLARLTGPAMHASTAAAAAFWKRGQKLGAVRDDLSVEALTGLLVAVKLALTSALLPADRAPTRAELATFIRVHVDMVRRIAERAPAPSAAPRAKGRVR